MKTLIEYNENLEISLVENVNVADSKKQCRHVKDNILLTGLKCRNEGGYNSTLLCVDCLIEWLLEQYSDYFKYL